MPCLLTISYSLRILLIGGSLFDLFVSREPSLLAMLSNLFMLVTVGGAGYFCSILSSFVAELS